MSLISAAEDRLLARYLTSIECGHCGEDPDKCACDEELDYEDSLEARWEDQEPIERW